MERTTVLGISFPVITSVEDLQQVDLPDSVADAVETDLAAAADDVLIPSTVRTYSDGGKEEGGVVYVDPDAFQPGVSLFYDEEAPAETVEQAVCLREAVRGYLDLHGTPRDVRNGVASAVMDAYLSENNISPGQVPDSNSVTGGRMQTWYEEALNHAEEENLAAAVRYAENTDVYENPGLQPITPGSTGNTV